MSTYTPSYYLSPPQSPPSESPQYQQQQYLHPYYQQQQPQQQFQQLHQPQHQPQQYQQQPHEQPKPPLLSVKIVFESSGGGGGGGGNGGRRVSIGFRSPQQAEQYAKLVRSKMIHHTERLASKVQGRYVSVRLPGRVTEVVACLAGPGAGASRVGGFYFVFNDPILAQEWVECLPLWHYVPGSRRKLYIERDVRDDVLHARLDITVTTTEEGAVVLVENNDEYHQHHTNLVASPVSLRAPSKANTEEVVTIYSAEGEELASPGLEVSRGRVIGYLCL
ncbi:hypothetical protein PG996_003950 [Apiospora saccharicola]|uniref:Uncharacterized protein n=1 Tax=Apiospora saccharicola TaxID=335842 RepID=A0ABR1W5P4_9PEZI